MTVKETLDINKDKILSIAKENGIRKVSVFGSIIRGEDTIDSDVDFLVEIDDNCSLFNIIRFKQEVEDIVGRKVDVVTDQSVHWTLKEHIINEAVQL
jgi:predicted nucleotidyltransferase